MHLDDNILSLGNGAHGNLELSEGEDVCRSRKRRDEVDDGRLGRRGREDTHRADHEVRDVSGHGRVGRSVLGEVGRRDGVSGGGRGGVHRAAEGRRGRGWSARVRGGQDDKEKEAKVSPDRIRVRAVSRHKCDSREDTMCEGGRGR